MTEREWNKFLKWCKERWPTWMPHKVSIEQYLEWKKLQKKGGK